MALTPDDIGNYPLKQAVRGYSVPQVDDLLDQVADTLERLTTEVEDLRHRLRQSEDRLAASSETESTLKRTLVTAQRAAEQSLDEAREQAAELVEEARREAAGILEDAQLDAEELRVEALRTARAEEAEIRRRRQSLEGHIEALRIFEREYRARLRGHLEDQLRTLDDIQHKGPGAPRLDDVDGDREDPPVEAAHLGGASHPDEPELRVRVRRRLDERIDRSGGELDDDHDAGPVDPDDDPDHDPDHDLDDDLDDGAGESSDRGSDDDPTDDRTGRPREVGSRPSEAGSEDGVRSGRRRSVP